MDCHDTRQGGKHRVGAERVGQVCQQRCAWADRARGSAAGQAVVAHGFAERQAEVGGQEIQPAMRQLQQIAPTGGDRPR